MTTSQPAETAVSSIQNSEVFKETTQPVGPPRRGVLIVDHQNLVGLCRNLGLSNVDPQWPLRMAQRITNVERAVLVTDLAISNPMTHSPYLHDIEAWFGNGYRIVHVPAKAQRIWDDQTSSEIIRRKDMTEHGLREELDIWRGTPGITDLLVLTHDVDAAKDLQRAVWSAGKRVTLLTVGTEAIAYQLKQHAETRANILEYPAAYSCLALERRRFWRIKNDYLELTKSLSNAFALQDSVSRHAYLRLQLADARSLIQTMYDKRLLHPDHGADANQFSWRLLRILLHDTLRHEKTLARGIASTSFEAQDRNTLESYEREFATAQTRACQASLDEMIRIFSEHGVLLHVSQAREGSNTIAKHFYLNLDHPAVKVLLSLDDL